MTAPRLAYDDFRLGFLPKTISAADADKIYLRSTPVPRAFESLQQALHGLYPTQDPSHIPQIAQRTFDDEALLPTSGCATAKALDVQYKKEAAVKYNHELEVLDSKIAGLVGV
jgi:acid phosphatase